MGDLSSRVKSAHLKADHKNVFSGLNEMLECEVSLDVCLSTVKLLMSEDR